MSPPANGCRIVIAAGLFGFALVGFLLIWAGHAVAEPNQIDIFHTSSVTGHLFACPS